MIKNYLLVGLRNLRKNISYVLINTFGLGIALACCIAAYLILAFNIEFNDFHSSEKTKNVYRIHSYYKDTDGKPYQGMSAPINLAPKAMADFSGIASYLRYNNESGYVRTGDDSFNEYISFADSTFFDLFDFPMRYGDQGSFKEMHTAILSRETAEKYFKDENPIGKVLILNFVNQTEISVVVGGVIEKAPINNSFVFDLLIRIEHFYDIHQLTNDSWGDWRDPTTFLLLHSQNHVPTLNTQLDEYIARRNKEKKDRKVLNYELQHFDAGIDTNIVRWSTVRQPLNIAPLVVFVSMAMIILLIACFNMTNTTIAMTARRMKEVGIRKVLGANKRQVASQFLFETIIIITLSMLVGVVFSNLIVPAFAEMWGLDYGLADLNGINLVVALLVLIFLSAIMAGVYPAFSNSKFRPVMLLKGSIKLKGTNFLTRSLIAIQFALSIMVLIAGVVFIQNTRFQENISFGYDKDALLQIAIQSGQEYEVMKNDIAANPKVKAVSGTYNTMGMSNYAIPVEVDTAKYEIRHYGVGENFFRTIGTKTLDGRMLNTDNTNDVTGAVVVNKAFLKKTGMTEPLNKIIKVHEVKRHIVGVIDNHIDNLFRSKEPEPAVFFPIEQEKYQFIVVKTDPEQLLTAQKEIEEIWKQRFPEKPFQSWTQDEVLLDNMRSTNKNLQQIFIFLTVLGGLLSTCGIFALASQNVEKRKKEIGIRKALGASFQHIILLMNKEFIILLFVAGIIGSLGGTFLTTSLLDEIYAYHIDIQTLPVLCCALLIITVGLSTTSYTIMLAAKANPVETLRNE